MLSPEPNPTADVPSLIIYMKAGLGGDRDTPKLATRAV
ncbi:hypothetical protein PhaeoP23_00011 [Phaeobacter piscinae]|uniref:Uncharacterized protein n=1 Tax=Phaeobacter piscinae TaxID=1580596 RepID=A0ABM6P8V0_9RHOB|nr:hypothetical protein PhaeoP36_00011 [Phaeobacter piscinae]ATG38152.1 hypothetical protein PhaeoP14_00011 [Phaeobacter piscinae]AUQ84712.1 hypothetical protein PhaeoP42_00011 [Phaeobacter piscinae]AUR22596.1 hypothetical protein PhaeoP23_00011 [Phaeobacter piscinae]